MTLTDMIPWAISLGCLIVAIIAFCTNSAAQKRLLQIEEAREQDRVRDTKQAKLTAQIVKDESGQHTSFKLEIRNDGQAEAQDVCVQLDGVPILQHDVLAEAMRQRLPEPPDGGPIGPAGVIRYILTPWQQCRGPFDAKITWSDGSGQPGKFDSVLTL